MQQLCTTYVPIATNVISIIIVPKQGINFTQWVDTRNGVTVILYFLQYIAICIGIGVQLESSYLRLAHALCIKLTSYKPTVCRKLFYSCKNAY